MRSRRQTGGLVPRSASFRLTILLSSLLFCSTVLGMIPAPVARTLRHRRFCATVRLTASGLIEPPAAAVRRGSGGWIEPKFGGSGWFTGRRCRFSTQDGDIRPAVGPAAVSVFALAGTFAALG